jgi:hypothetical protein
MDNKIKDVMNMEFTKMDPIMKKTLITHTINQTKIGIYKDMQKTRPITISYIDNFVPKTQQNVCEVNVYYKHSAEVAEEYILDTPVIMNVVGSEFGGTNFESNKDIYDEMLNIRTTFNNTIGTMNPYPIKNTDCVYAKTLHIIRPHNNLMGFKEVSNVKTCSLITVATDSKIKLVKSVMSVENYIKTYMKIECLFQAAIANFHNTLVLTSFSHSNSSNKYPVEDIIKIYNYCIFKYGECFKNIIIAVSPQQYSEDIYKLYDANIVRPQVLVTDIDKLYDQKIIHNNLMNKKS